MHNDNYSMRKYILYIRKSSESEDRQVMSLDAQENEMMRIAKRDDLQIVEVIKESHSAKTTGQRPEFNRMMKGIQSGKYNAILTWAPDRISRNAGDLGIVIDLMDAGKLECVQTYSQMFFNDPNSKFMFMMLGSQAKLENDQKSINVKRGNREKLKRGDWINGAPFGYLNDKATKKIILDPVRAPYVAQMFELYSTGLHSFKQIANTLYERGLRTKSNKKVHGSNIQTVVNRTFYYGIMESNGSYYKGNHEPIISQKIFEQCQQVADNKSRPRAKTKGFTLSGFIKCANCGCSATGEIKKGKYIYYHCTNGRGNCTQKSLNANETTLHEQIAIRLDDLNISQTMIDIVYRAKLEELEQTGDFHNHTLDSALQTQKSLTERKSRLVDTFTAGDIDEDLYRQKLQTLNNDSVKLASQIEEMRENTTDPYTTIELIYSEFKRGNTIAEQYRTAPPEEKRIMLADALSNSTLLDRNIVDLQYKSPYDIFARTPVNVSFSELLPDRDSNRLGRP